jgi:RNA polymerase-binding transcription factor DksA
MDTEHFKQKLLEELKKVETELAGVASKDRAGEWEAKETAMDTLPPMADANEAADKIEEYEENLGIDSALAAREREIKDALAKIDSGTYGACEVCGAQIEAERLEANPAARTCLAHLDAPAA